MIATDDQGLITLMNPLAEALTGWRQEDALGRDLTEVFTITDGQEGAPLQGPVGVASHTTLLAQDGTQTPIDHTAALIRDDEGHTSGVVWAFRDVTARRQAEEEAARLQTQLLQAQKMEAIGTLAGGVAHDFNNLLTAITGYSQLLLSSLTPDDPRCADVDQIVKAAKRAASLTHQLLAFSRQQVLQPQVLDVNAVVADTEKMLRRLIGEDIELITLLDPTLPRVKADQGQTEQVIMNLAVNARDAMPHGGKLTIQTEDLTLDRKQCSLLPEARPGRFVCLSVSDTGIGMDEQILQHIFEPFFTTKDGGTGLGLSVVYGIVRQHQGWISVHSQPGKGSTFKVYLPALSAAPQSDIAETLFSHGFQGRGEAILLVEDDEAVRGITAKMLGESGYTVFGAATAREALEIFERERGNIRLVFSDVVLPDQTGLQLVDQLLSHNGDLEILMSSGYTDRKSQWAAVSARGLRFVQKPYVWPELLHTIRKAIAPS